MHEATGQVGCVAVADVVIGAVTVVVFDDDAVDVILEVVGVLD